MNEDTIPVLIGAGQVTEKDPEPASSPLDLMLAAASLAAEDAGIQHSALQNLDAVVVVRSFREPMRNTPEALAERLGAPGAQQWLTPDGGYAPQLLVNRFFEAISKGQHGFVLLAGAEAMATGRRIVKAGGRPAWDIASERDAEYLYPDKSMWTEHERKHGIWQASHVYPLFENALRQQLGHSIDDHQLYMGRLFAPFTEVAASSPHAWYPVARTAEEIAWPSNENRLVGWPYTKYMNAMNQINQSAALLLTSLAEARRMGVPDERLIYLHGCADTTEIWELLQRVNYYSSPAIRVLGEELFAMANMGIEDIDLIDIYSCFPSAVQIARNELGIPADDPRRLTVTGGLPFHGGAGNNYVMNAIATMMDRLREKPGSFGLVTANGGYLGRHSAGIYSTNPTADSWSRRHPEEYQPRIDNLARPIHTEQPEGRATIETYTVAFDRNQQPEQGIVIGRLGDGSDPNAHRFIANTPVDQELMAAMTRQDYMGAPGRVFQEDGINRFAPD